MSRNITPVPGFAYFDVVASTPKATVRLSGARAR
jgi:hypothetical protein